MAQSRVVVNVAVGSWYPRGQRRLVATLRANGFDGDMLLWADEVPPGSPTAAEMHGAFKAHALEVAAARGYGPALWCDASTWFLRNPEPLFRQVERDGYYFWFNGDGNLGEWSADHALEKVGIGREESFGVDMLATTLFGLDLRSSVGAEALRRFGRMARDGTFVGALDNTPGAPHVVTSARRGWVSSDPRVLGHHRDQMAMSAVAHQMGLELSRPPSLFSYPSHPHDDGVVAMAENDGGVAVAEWERTGCLKR